MDMSTLHGMPKVSAGKSTPATRVTPSSPEVEEVRVEVAPRFAPTPTPKRSTEKLALRQEDSARKHKRAKVVVGKHKSRHDEGSSWVPSKDKGPVATSEEPALPARRRPKSMKELCGTTVRKNDEGYFAMHMTDLPSQDAYSDMRTRWENLKSSTQVWDDPQATSEFGRGVLHPQLAKELYMMPSKVLMAQAAKQIISVTIIRWLCWIEFMILVGSLLSWTTELSISNRR